MCFPFTPNSINCPCNGLIIIGLNITSSASVHCDRLASVCSPPMNHTFCRQLCTRGDKSGRWGVTLPTISCSSMPRRPPFTLLTILFYTRIRIDCLFCPCLAGDRSLPPFSSLPPLVIFVIFFFFFLLIERGSSYKFIR